MSEAADLFPKLLNLCAARVQVFTNCFLRVYAGMITALKKIVNLNVSHPS